MKLMFTIAIAALLSLQAHAQDPVTLHPDRYKVLLENDWVRVVRNRDKPGDKTKEHSHKNTLIYSLADQNRRISPSDGKPSDVAIKAGDVRWTDEARHSEENVGSTDGGSLLVEVKKPPHTWKPTKDDPDASAWPDSLDAVAAAPGNHKVVLDNDFVRVLEVTVRPGEKEPLHMHRMPSVLYVTAEDDIQDLDASGKVLYDTKTDKNPMKAPYAVWMGPQAPHLVINRSKNPLRLLRVELK
jgi:quercetin dioxygenase-like cupin family protein